VINLESWLEGNLYGVGVDTFTFRKPILWLIVFSLILPGCSTTSIPVNQYKIKPETISILEKDSRFMRLLELVRAAGKSIQLSDGLEFVNPDSTQVAIPYSAGNGERELVQAEIKNGTVTLASLNRIVLGADDRLTVTTSDMISGVAFNTTASRDSAGKVTILSYQVGTASSNETLAGMLKVAQIQPQQNCTDQFQNYLIATSAQTLAGYAMLGACVGGVLFLSPGCWLAAGGFLIASAAAIFAGDQLKRCLNQGMVNTHTGVMA
jgi:hypothetical protein